MTTVYRRGDRLPLSLRVTWETRKMVERAAARSGRSLTQEAEHLLERALRDEWLLAEIKKLVEGEA
ncbi:MAG TPA: hypothetical protein VEA35_00455 [Ramlibacter sp.]|nr:hypothetical protein [Ramlibacter sp.]